MKVNISHTFEVTEEQRSEITSVVEGKVMKRRANREQCRAFIEDNGFDTWEERLAHAYGVLTGAVTPEAHEDLIGGESGEESFDPDLIAELVVDSLIDLDDLI